MTMKTLKSRTWPKEFFTLFFCLVTLNKCYFVSFVFICKNPSLTEGFILVCHFSISPINCAIIRFRTFQHFLFFFQSQSLYHGSGKLPPFDANEHQWKSWTNYRQNWGPNSWLEQSGYSDFSAWLHFDLGLHLLFWSEELFFFILP